MVSDRAKAWGALLLAVVCVIEVVVLLYITAGARVQLALAAGLAFIAGVACAWLWAPLR